MAAEPTQSGAMLDELKPGDRIEVEHIITTGPNTETTKTAGTVVRTERSCQGRLDCSSPGGGALADAILIELPDGELTSVAIDRITKLRRA